MKIILNKTDEEFFKDISPVIAAKFATAQIIAVDDLSTLQEVPDLIVTEDLSFFEKLTLPKAEIRVIVLLKSEEVKNNDDFVRFSMKFKSVSTLNKPVTILDISALIYDLFANMENVIQPRMNFCPIKIELLKKMNDLPCDLYVKLSDAKAIKVANKGDPAFQEHILDKYALKGIIFMYVLDTEFKKIELSILERIAASLKVTTAPAEKGIMLSKSTIMIAKDFGVSDVLLDSIDAAYSSIAKDLDQMKLGSLIEKLNRGDNPFLSNHSHMTSIFSMIICKHMNWNTDRIRNNFCMASLLHDVYLSDIPDVTYEHESSFEFIKSQKLEYQTIIFGHPRAMADKIVVGEKISSDVVNIIAKHHEGRSDKSFPLGLSPANLLPVNFLFNVAHQFAVELYSISFNEDRLGEAFANLREYYPSSHFSHFIDVLENAKLGSNKA